MDARRPRVLGPVAIALFLSLWTVPVGAAGYRTKNFSVAAPTPQLAKEIGDTAEHWRRELAQEWLGHELPTWSKLCPIKAHVAPRLGAGGATSFVFDRGEVFDWRMNIQGSRERILDSVLPHEITHTIFASHFRRPLPRWADEGACTTVEHHSEIAKQENMLIDFLKTGHGIPFSAMFLMTEYPPDVLPLYAQGHSLARFLIEQQGKREFLAFLGEGMESDDWTTSINQHYGYRDLLSLQNSWLEWVRQGRPTLQPTGEAPQIASAEIRPVEPAGSAALVRGQDPDSGSPVDPFNPVSAQTAATRVVQPRSDQVVTDPWIPTISPTTATPPVGGATGSAAGMTDQSVRPATHSGSVYDASRDTGTLWR